MIEHQGSIHSLLSSHRDHRVGPRVPLARSARRACAPDARTARVECLAPRWSRTAAGEAPAAAMAVWAAWDEGSAPRRRLCATTWELGTEPGRFGHLERMLYALGELLTPRARPCQRGVKRGVNDRALWDHSIHTSLHTVTTGSDPRGQTLAQRVEHAL